MKYTITMAEKRLKTWAIVKDGLESDMETFINKYTPVITMAVNNGVVAICLEK
jgi:hypothetical protein